MNNDSAFSLLIMYATTPWDTGSLLRMEEKKIRTFVGTWVSDNVDLEERPC